MECVAGSGVAREYVPEEDHQIVMASLDVGTLCSESMLIGEAYCSWQQVNYRRETNRTTWFLLVPTSGRMFLRCCYEL